MKISRLLAMGVSFQNEKSLPGNSHKAVGEAGGEAPGKIHAR